MGSSKRHVRGVMGMGSLVVVVGIGACGGRIDDPIGTTAEAVTASYTISGTVTDSSGNPIAPPVTIALAGSAQKETLSNPATGAYSFVVGPGSYSLTASTQCLVFSPANVNVNNVHANTTVNFVGSGNDILANCEPATSSGATSGTLTIHGVVSSAGHAVAGAKVTLNGSTQGFRYADETGAYSFSVNRGSYTVTVSGACSAYTPSTANLNNITTSQTLNFTGSGNCPPAPLTLCPTLDTDFDLVDFGDVCAPAITTNACIDRLSFYPLLAFASPALSGADCRFGQLASLFSPTQVNQYVSQLEFFTPYLFGCPYVGTQAGPLTDVLVPQPLVAQGFKFTTADVQALSDDFVIGVEQTLAAFGTPALTAAQVSALQAQLTYLQTLVPGVVQSSKFTYSTCAADAGTQ